VARRLLLRALAVLECVLFIRLPRLVQTNAGRIGMLLLAVFVAPRACSFFFSLPPSAFRAGLFHLSPPPSAEFNIF